MPLYQFLFNKANLSSGRATRFGFHIFTRSFGLQHHHGTQSGQGDTFYIIREGTCSVMQSQSPHSQPVEVTELSPSDYFGELALLNDEARQASVIAKTKVSYDVSRAWSSYRVVYANTLYSSHRSIVSFCNGKNLSSCLVH